MAKNQKPIHFSENSKIFENLKVLQEIYNIKTNTKLLEHIVNLELKRHDLPQK